MACGIIDLGQEMNRFHGRLKDILLFSFEEPCLVDSRAVGCDEIAPIMWRYANGAKDRILRSL